MRLCGALEGAQCAPRKGVGRIITVAAQDGRRRPPPVEPEGRRSVPPDDGDKVHLRLGLGVGRGALTDGGKARMHLRQRATALNVPCARERRLVARGGQQRRQEGGAGQRGAVGEDVVEGDCAARIVDRLPDEDGRRPGGALCRR